MGSLLFVAILAGLTLGVLRAIVHLNFGLGWMAAMDAVFITGWSAYSYAQGYEIMGAALLLFAAMPALAARAAWKAEPKR